MPATQILLLIVNVTIKFAICACVYARYRQKTEDRWLRPSFNSCNTCSLMFFQFNFERLAIAAYLHKELQIEWACGKSRAGHERDAVSCMVLKQLCQ
jgi:hypothetical protein